MDQQLIQQQNGLQPPEGPGEGGYDDGPAPGDMGPSAMGPDDMPPMGEGPSGPPPGEGGPPPGRHGGSR